MKQLIVSSFIANLRILIVKIGFLWLFRFICDNLEFSGNVAKLPLKLLIKCYLGFENRGLLALETCFQFVNCQQIVKRLTTMGLLSCHLISYVIKTKSFYGLWCLRFSFLLYLSLK